MEAIMPPSVDTSKVTAHKKETWITKMAAQIATSWQPTKTIPQQIKGPNGSVHFLMWLGVHQFRRDSLAGCALMKEQPLWLTRFSSSLTEGIHQGAAEGSLATCQYIFPPSFQNSLCMEYTGNDESIAARGRPREQSWVSLPDSRQHGKGCQELERICPSGNMKEGFAKRPRRLKVHQDYGVSLLELPQKPT